LARDALKKQADKMGIKIKVETNGSSGIKNLRFYFNFNPHLIRLFFQCVTCQIPVGQAVTANTYGSFIIDHADDEATKEEEAEAEAQQVAAVEANQDTNGSTCCASASASSSFVASSSA
jgi:phage shock protein PspC (stress-responsive transcriptional regulator)